jgi:inhibitor of KinA sporulation pathway (predicted exonuclease)
MPDTNQKNQLDECPICGSEFESYRATIPLPYCWILLLHDQERIEEFKSYTRPCTEVCESCQSQIDFVISETATLDDPTEMDDIYREFILGRFDTENIFDVHNREIGDGEWDV